MKTIAFVVQKGGVGKTTLAVSMAALAASSGQSVSFIDADSSRSARKWVSRRPADVPVIDLINVFDIIDGRKEDAKKHPSGHKSGPTIDEVEVFDEAYELARESGTDWLFVDTSAGISEIAAAAVAKADLVLIPCPPSALDLEGVQPTSQLIKRLRAPGYFVINKGRQSKAINDDCALYLTSTYGLPAAAAHILLRVQVADVVDHGITLPEASMRDSSALKGQEELRALWKWVLATIDGSVEHPIELTKPKSRSSAQQMPASN